MGVRRAPGRRLHHLTPETIERTALPLERVHNIHGRHGLPLGVLCVGDGIANDVLQEDLEDAAGFFVDEARNALDTTAAG